MGEEDRDEQVLGQDRVDLDPAGGVGRERDLLLDGDEGTDLAGAEDEDLFHGIT